jgi:hypothetical protein
VHASCSLTNRYAYTGISKKKPFHLKKTSGGGKTAGREKERIIGYPDRYMGGIVWWW